MAPGDVRHFEWIAPVYDHFMPAAGAAPIERGFDLAARSIDRIVDVGGGTGRAARATGVSERIVADPARGMLARARDHHLEAIQAEGSQLPLRNHSVDAVLIVDALHHIPHQQETLAETYRVLRPGGVLIVRDFDPTTIRGRLLVAGEHLVGFESTFRTPTSLSEAMADSGFDPRVLERGFGYTVVGRVQ